MKGASWDRYQEVQIHKFRMSPENLSFSKASKVTLRHNQALEGLR